MFTYSTYLLFLLNWVYSLWFWLCIIWGYKQTCASHLCEILVPWQSNKSFVVDKDYDYNQRQKSKSLSFWKLFICDLFLTLNKTTTLSIKEVRLASSPASFQPLLQSSCSLSAWIPHSQGLWTAQEFKKGVYVCP